MAIVKCRECGGQVSTKADKCPSCGATQPTRTTAGTVFIGAMAVVAVIGLVAQANRPETTHQPIATAQVAEKAPPPVKSEAEQKADREINIVLTGARLIRDSLKKPESFELLRAGMIDGKTICYEYRARNSFNDRTTETYVITDKVKSNKAGDWNKHCAGKTGTDYSSVKAVL